MYALVAKVQQHRSMFVAFLALIIVSSQSETQAAPGLALNQVSVLFGAFRVSLTQNNAKILHVRLGTTYVCDEHGNVTIYCDRMKRIYRGTLADFSGPGQQSAIFVTGMSLQKVVMDLDGKTGVTTAKLPCMKYNVAQSFIEKEARDAVTSGRRRYRVHEGTYVVYEKFPLSNNIQVFLQKFFGMPAKPRGIPVDFRYTDLKKMERIVLSTVDAGKADLGSAPFKAPVGYKTVAAANAVASDQAAEDGTGKYFDSIGKFLHD